MIFIKNKIKRIFSLLACALIIVSALPIGASAAVTDGFYVNLGLVPNSSWSSRADFPDIELAYDQLTLFYRSDKDGSLAYINPPTGQQFIYESSTDYDICIENRSYYEMYFYLVIAGVYCFPDRYVIPAEGELILDFDVINDYVASTGITRPTTLTLWTNETCAPTYKGPVLNTNYANLNIYVGSKLHSVKKVYAPQDTYDSYTSTLYDMYRSGDLNLSDVIDGYKFDWQDYGNTKITIDPDKVNSYNIYYDIKLNTSYSIIYAETPKGTTEVARIYPSQIEDHDVTSSVTYLTQWLSNEGLIPDVVDGYAAVWSLSPEIITVDPDKVNTYTIKYVDLAADKKIVIYYYDQDSKLIKPMTYYVNSNASDFTVPQLSPYVSIPYKLDLIEGVMTETFNVYCIDFSQAYDAAYQKGYDDALTFKQEEMDALLKEAFDKGKNEGLSQNHITNAQKEKLLKDYNVITAFFDGLFTGLLNAASYLFEGISFGGITLGSVISAITVAIVVGFVIKKVF